MGNQSSVTHSLRSDRKEIMLRLNERDQLITVCNNLTRAGVKINCVSFDPDGGRHHMMWIEQNPHTLAALSANVVGQHNLKREPYIEPGTTMIVPKSDHPLTHVELLQFAANIQKKGVVVKAVSPPVINSQRYLIA